MSSVGGINSNTLNAILMNKAGQRPDPAEKFKELDTDGNGSLDKTELSAMAKELSSMTGKTVDLVGSMSTYDANNDGSLSQDETGAMIQQVLGPPPEMGGDFNTQQAMKAYQANSGDDTLTTLLKALEESSSSSSNSGTSTDALTSLLDALGNSNASSSSTDGTSNDALSTLLKILSESQNTTATQQRPPDPAEKFKELDTDGNGSLNKSELDVMAKDFAKMTGQTIDTTKAISTYDSNGDGELNQTEMDTMMKALHDKSGGPPPKPEIAGQSSSDSVNERLMQLLA